MPTRRATSAVVGVLALIMVAACGPTMTTPNPASPSGPAGSVPIESAVVSPDTSATTPSASAGAIASGGASGSPPAASPVGPCPVARHTVTAPSDRLVDVAVSSGGSSDVVSFVFGPPSLEGPPGSPTGTLSAAKPPYTRAGSGSTLKVAGSRVARIVFNRLSTVNDVGEPTYGGRTDIKTTSTALREVVLFDDSEGVMGWFIGFDGPGCATLTASGDRVIVTIAHL